jgi:hypothetical protein
MGRRPIVSGPLRSDDDDVQPPCLGRFQQWFEDGGGETWLCARTVLGMAGTTQRSRAMTATLCGRPATMNG